MNYFKYILLASLLVLTGAGCGLQQPEPEEDTSKESATSQALKAENDRLKKENEKLKKSSDEKEEKKKDDDKEEEKTDEEKDTSDSPDEENLNSRERELIGDLPNTDDLGDNRIDIFLVSQELGTGSETPTFKFGCENYLYPISITIEDGKSQSDLATAIVQLLTYKPGEDEGENVVRGKGILLANVTYEDGKRIIELEGEDITSAGVCEDERIKAQLEETVALYSDNFEIRLNGSAQDWDDLFNLAG